MERDPYHKRETYIQPRNRLRSSSRDAPRRHRTLPVICRKRRSIQWETLLDHHQIPSAHARRVKIPAHSVFSGQIGSLCDSSFATICRAASFTPLTEIPMLLQSSIYDIWLPIPPQSAPEAPGRTHAFLSPDRLMISIVTHCAFPATKMAPIGTRFK